ncbi:hypothetical protein KC366_g84 [Hortaea werneckii]|nr:hypothetical protein KC366_g84 [Hortaea werneckii]
MALAVLLLAILLLLLVQLFLVLSSGILLLLVLRGTAFTHARVLFWLRLFLLLLLILIVEEERCALHVCWGIALSLNIRAYFASRFLSWGLGFSRSEKPVVTLKVMPSLRTRVFFAFSTSVLSLASMPMPAPTDLVNFSTNSGFFALMTEIALLYTSFACTPSRISFMTAS